MKDTSRAVFSDYHQFLRPIISAKWSTNDPDLAILISLYLPTVLNCTIAIKARHRSTSRHASKEARKREGTLVVNFTGWMLGYTSNSGQIINGQQIGSGEAEPYLWTTSSGIAKPTSQRLIKHYSAVNILMKIRTVKEADEATHHLLVSFSRRLLETPFLRFS